MQTVLSRFPPAEMEFKQIECLKHLSSDLKDSKPNQILPHSGKYSKTFGVEWNSITDHFCLTIIDLTSPRNSIAKRALVSNFAKMYDIFGWFSPCTKQKYRYRKELVEMVMSD